MKEIILVGFGIVIGRYVLSPFLWEEDKKVMKEKFATYLNREVEGFENKSQSMKQVNKILEEKQNKESAYA